MLARVVSVSDEDIHVRVVGLIENVAVERLIGKRSSERRIVVVCMGWGRGGGVCLGRKVFADKGSLNLEGEKRGVLLTVAKLNCDG